MALNDLTAAISDLCASHRREKGSTTPSPEAAGLQFLSDLVQGPYHKAEDLYLAELTTFTKKQFFKVRNFIICFFFLLVLFFVFGSYMYLLYVCVHVQVCIRV